MKGLDLCAQYYHSVGAPMIADRFPDHVQRIAAGLVGDGSECFGFDDAISRDHDWGPGFCLWLAPDDYQSIGVALQRVVDELPREFAGYGARTISTWGQKRTGVSEIGSFYRRFIGFENPPESLSQWRLIPEAHLAAATNGKVFNDPLGEFTAFRKKLLAFYPEDIRLKMLASRCMTMAQAGQYNYHRCVIRGEFVAAQRAEAQFIDAAVSMVFLLNRCYKPYYKWMHRAMQSLPILGAPLYRLLSDLVTCHENHQGKALNREKERIIEDICARVVTVLKDQHLSNESSDFLLDHGPQIQAKIQDDNVRALNIWAP